ncbi:MAG TPA: hypothetical protein VG652_13045 [Gaiellaceae bacterium]|nr:hypothetical protein [Gaiellaceae bacterium]
MYGPRRIGTSRSAWTVAVAICALAGIAAGSGLAASVRVSDTPDLAKLLLTPTQVGPGYRLMQRPDGHGVKGFVTLDMCGYKFGSEKLRTNRLQVNYVHSGNAVTLSNEIVTYRPGGAVQALEEVAYAASHCPSTPLRSMAKGISTVSFKVSPVPLMEPLPAGSVAYAVTVSLTYKGKQTKENDIVVYQIRGNVLSGVYGFGGTLAARTRATLASAMKSARDLRQIELVPANIA